MIRIRTVFLKGLFLLLPVVVTIYLIVWLITGLESMFGAVLRIVVPDESYMPGMGLAAAVVVIFAAGLLARAWIARKLWQAAELLLGRTPIVSQIYGAIKEIVSYVGGGDEPAGRTVVTLTVGDPAIRMLGFVTREDFRFASEKPGEELIAVFLPWSYQIGGFTVFVPRSAVEPVSMDAKAALRLILTAGVTTKPPAEA